MMNIERIREMFGEGYTVRQMEGNGYLVSPNPPSLNDEGKELTGSFSFVEFDEALVGGLVENVKHNISRALQ
jgi:hypothetical protein